MKVLVIASSVAQVKMFKLITDELNNFEIKFINTGLTVKGDIEDLLNDYKFKFETLDRIKFSFIKEILEIEKPDIILTGHDQTPIDVLFIKAANIMKIPSLTVQDGMLTHQKGESNIKYAFKIPITFIKLYFLKKVPLRYLLDSLMFQMKYHNEYSYVYGHGESTKLAVFGESVRRMFISEGISPDRIVVTGNPKFDMLKNFLDGNLKEKIRDKWNIPSKKLVILLLTEYYVRLGIWTHTQRKFFVSEIVKSILELSNVHFIIKLHPFFEEKTDYIEILEEFPISYTIFKFEPLEEILCLSDIVMATASTTALESLVLGKPTLIINLFGEDRPKFYKDSGAIYIEKKDEILCNLRELSLGNSIIDQKKVKKFVAEQVHDADGKSSRRIADLIIEMIKENNT